MADYRIALHPEIADIPRLLDWVEACCAADGVAAQTALKLALAVEEAVVNTVNHGFANPGLGRVAPPRRIEVGLDIGPASIVAEITDNAAPFDPSSPPPPDIELPLAQREPGGLGIRLIHAMVDRVEYRRCRRREPPADGEIAVKSAAS